MNNNNRVLVVDKKPIKMSQWEKESLIKKVEIEIVKTTKLRKKVSRIHVKGGHVYLYELYAPSITGNETFSVPLIDGKYFEYIYARITIFDKAYSDCTLDWQRYNGQWITIEEGSLDECIQKAERSNVFIG